ncbi:MAG: flagellar basal body L-ring protein [Desulfovibrio sp.]|nr:MAG: flagellar basal body L-ring protein [Desulfovibrio sp.]
MLQRILLILAAVAVLSSCVKPGENASVIPTITPPPSEAEEIADGEPNPGSLFNPGNAEYLFSDSRARRVGDIVLVNIVESSRAENKAETETGRESSMNLAVDAWFGNHAFGVAPFRREIPQIGESRPFVDVSSSSEFEGTGETSRESSITATVAARVINVLPGGLLQVEGAREIRVNSETQIVVVRGLVRPRDIGSDNSIYSTHMADARIEYYGEGVVSDKQRPGWLVRLLDNVWPF